MGGQIGDGDRSSGGRACLDGGVGVESRYLGMEAGKRLNSRAESAGHVGSLTGGGGSVGDQGVLQRHGNHSAAANGVVVPVVVIPSVAVNQTSGEGLGKSVQGRSSVTEDGHTL